MKLLVWFSMFVAVGAGCATAKAPARSLVADAELKALGLGPDIAPWEDGLRTDSSPGTYEWWYFDSHLSDGTTLVVVFYTKPLTESGGPLAPAIQVDVTRPDGTKLSRTVDFAADAFTSAHEKCDVRLGPANRLEGDLHTYHLTVDVPDVKVDLTLTGAVPAWRPGAGRITFGAHDEKYFAWLPSVPEGRVEGTLVTEGQRQTISGTGYHDHNWGNASMLELMHHWYWGRARVGPYSLIASHITPAEAYDPTPFTIFMLAKDDRLVADDARQVRFSAFEEHLDDLTLKPVAAKLVYDFQGGDAHYRVTFARHRDIVRSRFIDSLRGLKWLAAKLVGFDAAYLRFTGEVTVERLDAHDAVVEAYRNSEAIWELMYLGHAPSR